ncbi:gamma-glutamyltransferase [Stieleria sp. JC731]|uniref:gamma-glutamyltransferase n=1 Tax=Pirellulaceae TaxID=2691357 RepID=UPI001E42E770|nr:gamma-glutamyltransferase [Stieleria sp. JC731]MCC9601605.1 gamma-glutamyltransferase [Stieleria sp. JC731]
MRSLSLAVLWIAISIPSSSTAIAQQVNPIPTRAPAHTASGKNGVVVSTSPLASRVGRDCLQAGGNAVDSAIAVGFALAVTWPEAGNIGGGGFMLIAPPEIDSRNDVVCIDFRETAPHRSHQKTFVGWNNARHAKMSGTPGSVAGMALAHDKFGHLPWKELLAPAIKLASEGFVVDDYLAYSLNSALIDPAIEGPRYEEFRRVFGHPEGRLWRSGDRLTQPDLAKTLKLISDRGSDGFYKGEVADKIAAEMERGNGLITLSDLQQYRALERTAYHANYLGYDVYGAPPPSSGGMTVGLQLQILEQLKLASVKDIAWTAPQIHLMVESMRRAFRNRAAFLGDPRTTISTDQYDPAAVRKLTRSIDRNRATRSVDIAGDIPISTGPYESEQTTHYSVIDREGLSVSTTTTLEHSFGSWIVVKDAGFLLNNEMGDFNWYPGYTNTEGRIGTQPNLVGPGKRMLSSMSPTIVAQNGRARLIVGSPGGRTIINTVTEVIVQNLGFERSLEEAVEAPRFHHQWLPDEVYFEDDRQLTERSSEVESMGHKVIQSPGRRQGSVHAIEIDQRTGIATGVSDWRRGGSAEAVWEPNR